MADTIYYNANTLNESTDAFVKNQLNGLEKQQHKKVVNSEVNQMTNVQHLQNLTHIGGNKEDRSAESKVYMTAVSERAKSANPTTKEAVNVKNALLAIDKNINLNTTVSTNVIQDDASKADYTDKIKVIKEKDHGTTRYFASTQTDSGKTFRREISASNAEALKKALQRHERVTIETGAGYLTANDAGTAYAHEVQNTEPQQIEAKKEVTNVKSEQRFSVNTKDSGINEGVQNETRQIVARNALDDKSAATAYAYNLKNSEINHIFHNDFYHEDPVPAWSFSVDFIPCTSNPQFDKIITMQKSTTLTKAVQKITAMDKSVNIQSINYLGMQHPFFTKMQATHGDLRITFAEDEYFTITSILTDILKYASFLPSFVTNAVYVKKQGDWSDTYTAYAASDTIAPKYRQNATDIQVDDPNIAKLIHQNKFVFDIVLKLYRAEYVHMFADNTMPPGFVYHYHDCWLKSMDSISLNYDDDSMIDRTATFSYQYMTSEPYSTYLSRHRTTDVEATDDFNTTASKDSVKQLVDNTNNEVNKTGNRSLANTTSEAARQFEKRISDETKTNGMTNQQAQAAQIAGEMHKYRR